jgi:hypothetical protein
MEGGNYQDWMRENHAVAGPVPQLCCNPHIVTAATGLGFEVRYK